MEIHIKESISYWTILDSCLFRVIVSNRLAQVLQIYFFFALFRNCLTKQFLLTRMHSCLFKFLFLYSAQADRCYEIYVILHIHHYGVKSISCMTTAKYSLMSREHRQQCQFLIGQEWIHDYSESISRQANTGVAGLCCFTLSLWSTH